VTDGQQPLERGAVPEDAGRDGCDFLRLHRPPVHRPSQCWTFCSFAAAAATTNTITIAAALSLNDAAATSGVVPLNE
jgi:hypothetical protein